MANITTADQSAAGWVAEITPSKGMSALMKRIPSVRLSAVMQGGTSPYERKKQELLSELTNMKDFSYDAEQDALYGQYKKQYLREGRRAGEHTLGEAAALTGGRASSYAVTAASQAEDNYAAKLADKIPELEAAAYQRYQKEFDRKKAALDAVSALDREYYSRQRDALSDQRYDAETAYKKERDALSDSRYDAETAYKKERDALSDSRYDAETAYKKERDSVSDRQYADELAYRASELAQKQAALEHDWSLQEKKLNQEKELALMKLAPDKEETPEPESARLSREEAERLKVKYGGTQLSENQWSEILSNHPEYSGAMLEAAGFQKYQSYSGRVEPTSKGYASAKASAEDLAKQGVPKEAILQRLWTLWRIGSITDSEWREFNRIYG